jgi:hypothetical protein
LRLGLTSEALDLPRDPAGPGWSVAPPRDRHDQGPADDARRPDCLQIFPDLGVPPLVIGSWLGSLPFITKTAETVKAAAGARNVAWP